MMTRAFALLALICLATGPAGATAAHRIPPDSRPVVLADWQYPDSLPERFRNHCSAEYFTGRPYCADHCGSGYQFFYCSEGSFGCCHLGRGYCDLHGILRCSP
jgi:hypothetical protein